MTQPGRAASRLLATETALVLAVSLGQSAVYAVLMIINRLTIHRPLNQQTSSLNVSTTPDRPWLDLAYQLAGIGFGVVPAVLALFLMATRAVPRPDLSTAVGLAPRRWGRDLALGFGLTALIGIPGLGLYLAARELGFNTEVSAANLTATWWTIPVLIGSAAMNGILEEMVMVGYLFTRWRQAGMRTRWVVVVSALIRGTYHLYQGFGGFVGNLIMGLIFGWFYLRTKRLWPLVIAHTALDVVAFVGYSLLKGHVGWL